MLLFSLRWYNTDSVQKQFLFVADEFKVNGTADENWQQETVQSK
jgi:hypothetical protein